MSSQQPASGLILRPRESPWPAISMKEALAAVESEFSKHLAQLQRTRIVQCAEVREGDVLAENVDATQPLPPFRASIKDGYAVRMEDGAGMRRVIGTKLAEKASRAIAVGSGECCRINTGAAVPEGADTVVQVEDTRLVEHDGTEELVIEIIKAPVRLGQDIREVGSDLEKGERLIDAGIQLQPAHIGLLALSQRREVTVYEPIRVAVMSTGDELSDAPVGPEWEKNEEGSGGSQPIRDTNRPMLLSLLRSQGFIGVDAGIVADNREALLEAMFKVLTHCPVLIVTGGVSMGERDYLKELLAEHLNFRIHFGRVWMKPGLPTTFASGEIELAEEPPSTATTAPSMVVKLPSSFVFALPGNPVSSFVTAHLFAFPSLRRASGWSAANSEFTRVRVKLAEQVVLDRRPEYRRAIFSSNSPISNHCLASDAEAMLPMGVAVSGSQISSRLLSTKSANLLLELPGKGELDGKERLEEGEVVTALVIGPI